MSSRCRTPKRTWGRRCCAAPPATNAAAGAYVDLVEAGIIDPTKVVRLALDNAVSAAGVLLLTDATMTEIPEAKPEPTSALEA